MISIKVIKVDNLSEIKLEQYSESSNQLFLTSTKSLSYKLNEDKKYFVMDFTEFSLQLGQMAKEKDCLKETEMRYILYKTINSLKDEKEKIAFRNSADLLYDLFDKLLISGVTINDINLKEIAKTQLKSNAAIFKLYTSYIDELIKQNKKLYQAALTESMRNYLNTFDSVSLFGFTFFNDIQNVMFKALVKHNKLKNIFVDDINILNEFLVPYLKEQQQDFEIVEIKNAKSSKFDSLKNSMFTNNKPECDLTSSLQFYKPFFTREMEFEFIVKQISSGLKQYSTQSEIERACEKYAVIITNQFYKHTNIFNDILKRQGLFIAPNNAIYYSQDEFLASDYKKDRPKEERLNDFASFIRLEMYEPPKTLFNSLIGRFISEIYKIAGKGLKLSNFVTLININWLFRNTAIDDIVSEFNVVKDFFENLESIEDWKKQIKGLIKLKNTISFENELRNHPLKAIRLGSLQFIEKYILFLDHTISKIKNVNGSIKKHIKALYEALKDQIDNELEEEFLTELSTLLKTKDNGIDIDFEYFSQNYVALINEYISSKVDKSNNIRLNAINLESAASYDTVFLPMFEENKYPMLFKYEFPYTKQIIAILQDKKLIKNYYLPLNKTLDYNVTLSKYVFKNLFNIAQEKIIFTRLENENGNPIEISIFGNEILSKFDNLAELDFTGSKEAEINKDFDSLYFKDVAINNAYLNDMLYFFVCPKMFYNMMLYENKNCYTDRFLLNFYCKALIVNNTLVALANDTVYVGYTILQELDKHFELESKKVFKLLPLFDDNSKNDILLTAKRQLKTFITSKILTGRYKPENEFMIILGKEKEIFQAGVKIKTYKSLVVIDNKSKKAHNFDITRSLDCLLSSSGGKQTTLTHFWEIVKELALNKYIDRLNSLNYLNFKLNTQLTTPKYVQDGVNRVGDIVEHINKHSCSNLNFEKSSACAFCKYKNICMGGVDYD